MLFKILSEIPSQAVKDGSVDPNTILPLVPLDLKDGFIHLSTESQVTETLNKYFGDVPHVIILHINLPDHESIDIPSGQPGNKLNSIVKWEFVGSRNQKFAHIYGDLYNSDVVKIEILEKTEGSWIFPVER